MAWHHISDETMTVPDYALRKVTRHAFGSDYTDEVTTRYPTGTTVEVTHSLWRCSACRKMACTKKGATPSKCGCSK